MRGCSTDLTETEIVSRPGLIPRLRRISWRFIPSFFLATILALAPLSAVFPYQGGHSSAEEAVLEHLRNGEFDEAIALEEKIIAENPGGTKAAKAQFSIAGIYLNFVNDYQRAFDAYKKVVEEYPNSSYVQDSYYRMALLSLKLGEVEETAQYLGNIEGSNGSLGGKANFLLGWLNRGRNVFYFQNKDTLMATSLSFEFIFILLWLLIGVIDKIHHLYKKKSFWLVFGLMIVILAFKLSVQYALFELVENL